MSKKLVLTVFGATGSIGRHVVEYLRENMSRIPGRWAIAGRNVDALNAIANSFNLPDRPQVVEMRMESASSQEDCIRESEVLLNLAGPFELSAPIACPLCVEHCTDYLDVSGEVNSVAALLPLHARAEARGIKLIPSCGFESVLVDLGVSLARMSLSDRIVKEVCSILSVDNELGSVWLNWSPGSLRSFLHSIRNGADNASILDPFALVPCERPETDLELDLHARWETRTQIWSAPNVVGQFINAAVINRTDYLFSGGGAEATGDFKGIRYRDRVNVSAVAPYWLRPATAQAIAAWARFVVQGLATPGYARELLKSQTQAALARSKQVVSRSNFRIDLEVRGGAGELIDVTIEGAGSPGSESTSRIVGECALTLVERRDASSRSGVVTPAIAFGVGLIPSLERARVRLSVC